MDILDQLKPSQVSGANYLNLKRKTNDIPTVINKKQKVDASTQYEIINTKIDNLDLIIVDGSDPNIADFSNHLAVGNNEADDMIDIGD